MRRFTVYFHYDPRGIADEACRLAVQAMRQAAGGLLFVSNGPLQEESRRWAVQCGARLLERENRGFDVGAYRQALLDLGPEGLRGYDEVILMNYTLAGPVCPLDPMLAAMEARPELDFWGLTRHYAMVSRRFGGHVPEHLQSHFLALRPRLFLSDAFWQYWQTIRLPRSYEEAVALHEVRFTDHFAALGFRWDSYVHTDDWRGAFLNPIMACPQVLLEERGCPFFKRRSFFTDYRDELRRTAGTAAGELYGYLKNETDYPVDSLLQSLLHTQPLAALASNLHWRYALPEQAAGMDGLQCLRFSPAPPSGNPTVQWYLAQTARWAEAHRDQAAALFAREPLLGVLSPALPPWDGLREEVGKQWRQALPALRAAGLTVPWDESRPPPAPRAGWVLVRREAFPDGIPEDPWLLPFLAQQNGYFSAVFAPPGQMAAEGEQLALYQEAAARPAAVVRQLGRLAKHTLKKGR